MSSWFVAWMLLAACTERSACKAGGGEWDACGYCSPVCEDGEAVPVACAAVCEPSCACPEDAPIWDSELGCLPVNVCEE